MAKESTTSQIALRYLVEKVTEILDNLGKNNLWKRVLKNVLATTILGKLCLIS